MQLDKLIITPESLKLIAEIDEFNSHWVDDKTQKYDVLTDLKKVSSIESIGSSTRIEGVQLSNKEIDSLLSQVSTQSFASRDEQEIRGYSQTLETIFDNFQEIQISENYIKQLHSSLLKYATKDSRHKGQYKKHINNVEAFDKVGKSLGIVFKTTSPFDTPNKMQELIYQTRETLADKSYHPLLVVAIFVVEFLTIHPFSDGNGRLSRLLTTLIMLKMGYDYIAYTSLESIIEKNKERYYQSLQQTQATLEKDADYSVWLHFFLRCLKKQKDHLQSKLKSIKSYQHLPLESVQIMQYLDNHARITIAQACDLITTTTKPTIKNRLKQLVVDNYLIRYGKARATWYAKK